MAGNLIHTSPSRAGVDEDYITVLRNAKEGAAAPPPAWRATPHSDVNEGPQLR